MNLGIFQKTPIEQIDVDVVFDKWLPSGDTITSAEAVVSPTGELVVPTVVVTDQAVKVWLNDGLDGHNYHVDVTVSTAGGRIKEAGFKVRVKDC